MAKDLDTIKNFTQFLEWVSNPQAAKATLEDLKKTLENLEKQNKIINTVEKADQYFDKKVKELQERQDALIEKEATLEKEKASNNAFVAKRKADQDARDKAYSELIQKLEQREIELSNYSAKLADLVVSLNQREAEIVGKEKHLAGVETELAAKAAALKQILG